MTAFEGFEVRRIGGFPVLASRADPLIATLTQRREAGLQTELLFANTNFVMTCREMTGVLDRPSTVIVNDGIGLDLASWYLHGSFFPENLAGSDFIPKLFASLTRETRVYLLGARPASVAGTARAWDRLPHVRIVGARDGYGDMQDEAALIEDLNRVAPDVLFVALGDPLQARWIVAQRGLHRVPLVLGVGALFDFASGRVPRAPRWLRMLRLEWAYRLFHEPRRLLKRYSVDVVAFLIHCVRTNRAERRSGRMARRAT